jgi:ribosomal protein S18 acetylase RimI-like enzyme
MLDFTWENSQLVTSLQRISEANVMIFKAVRLRALSDTPLAFGSTYAKEAAFPEEEWISRAARMNGEKSIGFLAMDNETPCGIAACFLNQQNLEEAWIVSMWVASSHRQRGVGRQIVDEIRAWARLRQAKRLQLMVTSINNPAILFYEKLGFSQTGRTEPYPNDPSLIELEMTCQLL